MALQMTVETKSGVLIDNCYIRIDEIGGTKEQLNIRVRLYISKEKRENGVNALEENIFSFTPSIEISALNFIMQGYLYLKSLPEFINAIDN